MKSRVATLKSIELAGFKSFAKRTKIDFSSGLVAIVGPNGSGKSNIADAVRWVFGEQKTRSLRMDKSEDLIYHGGKDKAQASMAEVVITLDNSDGSIPVDLNEIEITRRLYRSGENNYLLNGRKTTLSLIQEILSASGFGVGSYTVIGQGMIDKLILSSGQERKQLFEEASGIKQYEIKLSQTFKKIEATRENLSQIDGLINELSPHHETLIRQSELLEKRNNLLIEIDKLRNHYVWGKLKHLEDEDRRLQKQLDAVERNISKLNVDLSSLEKSNNFDSNNRSKESAEKITKELSALESKKEIIDSEISKNNIELEQLKVEIRKSDPIVDITTKEIKNLEANLQKHIKDQKKIEKLVDKYEAKLNAVDDKIKLQTKSLEDARKEMAKSQKSEYLKHSLGLIDIIQDGVRRQKDEDELSIVFYKLKRMIKHSLMDNSAELALKVGKIQNTIARLLDERENINEAQTNEIIKLRAIEMDYSSIESKVADLKKSLAIVEKANNTSKIQNQIDKCSLKLGGLEKTRSEIIASIAITRQELVDIAQVSVQQEKDEYYKKHEELSNEKVGLEQERLNIKSQLENTKNQSDDLGELCNKWSIKKQQKRISTPIDVSLDEINRVEAELGLLEDINPDISKEATETSKQMQYLSSQKDDLEKALINLEKVAAETSLKMTKVFEKGFESINSNFAKNFKQLFGGGDAGLKLNRDEDRGIDIMVKLPNKKVQNISSLSGGEKALASVALLSGILASNPSPFVVLDEVDAALDAENTKKFADVLTRITKHSQVLVVTHNHDTMSAADELIGITTSGNNDSRIIKVRLDSLPQGSLKE
jgi:chromosome segregation protein